MQNRIALQVVVFTILMLFSVEYTHPNGLNKLIHSSPVNLIGDLESSLDQNNICVSTVKTANIFLENGKFELALDFLRRYGNMKCNISSLNGAVLSKIGHLTIDGNGTPQNINGGIQYLEEALDFGDCKSNTILGYVYLDDSYKRKNIKTSVGYFQTAAVCGDFSAHYISGILYGDPDYGIQDMSKALYHLEIAAHNKYPDAYGVIGKIYYYGDNIDEDINKALQFFLLGANNGDGESAFFASAIYFYDKNNVKDAALWMFVSILLGFPCEDEAVEFYTEVKSRFISSEIDAIMQIAHKKCEGIIGNTLK